MKYPICFLLLLFAFPSMLLAKKDVRCTIISLTGDSIQGQAKIKFNLSGDPDIDRIQYELNFSGPDGVEKLFKPADLRGIIFFWPTGDTSFFQSISLEELKNGNSTINNRMGKRMGTHIFLDAKINQGRLLFYNFYYLDGAGSTSRLVTVDLLLRDKDWYELPQEFFRADKRKYLVFYLRDCPEVVAVIKEKKLDVNTEMEKIVKRYNACSK